jgi:RNA polymerase sigma factor (sigma-70 family)
LALVRRLRRGAGKVFHLDISDRLERGHFAGAETIGGGETIAEPDERLSALYAFIGQLDELNRALILLYLEDRSYGEIAEILGISETNVATKISRIKHTLRGQMTGAATTGA